MDSKVWVVGEHKGRSADGVCWDMVGVFDDEELAIQACAGINCFVGPLTLNVNVGGNVLPWPDVYYPSIFRIVRKELFAGEWPFVSDVVHIFLKGDACVVAIDGKCFALNGVAQDQFKYKDVHDAGKAVVGVSIKPFLDMALALGKIK